MAFIDDEEMIFVTYRSKLKVHCRSFVTEKQIFGNFDFLRSIDKALKIGLHLCSIENRSIVFVLSSRGRQLNKFQFKLYALEFQFVLNDFNKKIIF